MEIANEEMLMSGYINLLNFIKMNPQLENHPILQIAVTQIQEGLGPENVEHITV